MLMMTRETKNKKISLTDNNYNKEERVPWSGKIFNNLKDIAQKDLSSPDLLVFPSSIDDTEINADTHIIELIQDSEEETNKKVCKIRTGNIMGFVGKDNVHLRIHSRFDDMSNEGGKEPKGNFLYYMLSKVLNINLTSLETTTSAKDSILNLLFMFFPKVLKEALAQGLYKEYRYFQYNDDRVRGAIEVSRFIREDIPFRGKIAYRTRELSHNNNLLHLVRHTIEYLRSNSFGRGILNNDLDTRNAILQVVNVTPDYQLRDRRQIIQSCKQLKSHPFYTKYRALQKLCLSILRHERVVYGEDNDKGYGLLFDGAWLWEEYLNTLLKPLNFIHPENKKGQGGINLFNTTPHHTIYPDFYKEGQIVADAKYKRYAKEENENKREVAREDLYQIITYMYRLNIKKGIFLCPSVCKEEFVTPYKIGDNGATIEVIGLSIPQNAKLHFRDFCTEMRNNEYKFIGMVKKTLTSMDSI